MPTSGDVTLRGLSASAEATLAAAGVEDARREAARLASWAMDVPLSRYYAVLGDPFPADRIPAFESAVRRRAAREPFAYITGTGGFLGREFSVGPGVLVPRPETEILVLAALGKAMEMPLPSVDFLDLCTGSGCVAVSLALELRIAGRSVHGAATDVSEKALRFARSNAHRLAGGIDLVFLLADLFPPFGRLFDLIVSNPPYVAAGVLPTLSPEIAGHEPKEALDGGEDGLDFYRRIVDRSPRFLRTGGWLVMEHGSDQGASVPALLATDGRFTDIETLQDLAGRPRVTLARYAGPSADPTSEPLD